MQTTDCDDFCVTLLLNTPGKYYYVLRDDGVDNQVPRDIDADWGIRDPIDAALTYKNGITYIFKVHNYARQAGANVMEYCNLLFQEMTWGGWFRLKIM